MNNQNYTYPIETLSPNDFNEWVEHCGSVFNIGSEYFRRHFVNDPHKDYNSVFIIKSEEGKIISTVRVFHRQVYIGGKIYKMGGIGEVSTNENYRRLGLSYKLLAAATEYMIKNDFYLSMLGTGYFSHYEKHGFMKAYSYGKDVGCDAINEQSSFHAPSNFVEPPDIRPLNTDNFHDMAMLYNKYCVNFNCCIVRTKEYWQSWCAGEIKNPYGLFRDNKLVGYICFYGGNRVTELVADENDYDILLSVIKSDNGKIGVPAFVKTVRKLMDTDFMYISMICVYKPIDIDGKGTVLSDTASVVEYLNNNGGFISWGQDGF
jgi:predicted acetyltransferase